MKSNSLRNSARGQECTFGIVSVCNGNPETVVLCHLPDESHGMARKATDFSSAYACSACHDAIDRRTWCEEYEEHRWFYNYRALIRTITSWFEAGLISIKGAK